MEGASVLSPPQTAGALAAGTVLAGRYEIVEVLDRGGHGAVYRAKQRPLGREVAVKVMLPEVAAGPGMSARFAREVSLVQRLEHPNTVRLYDFGATDDGTAFMVFELLRGRSLESEMAKGPMAPERVAKITVQILKSLMEAHGLGIVHRDVKPANVLLVDYSGEPDFVKVLDFGVARTVDEVSRERAITRDGQLVGTPAYMAPEQVKGEPITARTDLYALGIMMGEMLSGQLIFEGQSAAKIWMQQASAAPVPLPGRARSSVLGEVVERATQKDARARHATAAAMIAAIESAIRGRDLAPTDPLATPIVAATDPLAAPLLRPAPTAPFASAPPPAHAPTPPPAARTPLVHTRPPPPLLGDMEPAHKALIIAAGVFGLLVMLGLGIAETVRSTRATHAAAVVDTPFHLASRAQAEGWGFEVIGSSTFFFQGRAAHTETYRVTDGPLGSNVAMLAALELATEEDAAIYEKMVTTAGPKARSGRYIVHQSGLETVPFSKHVFQRLTR